MKLKKIAAAGLAGMLVFGSIGYGLAQPNVGGDGMGGGSIQVTVEPLIISATVPTGIAAYVDPNKQVIDYEGDQETDSVDTFVSPSFTVSNNCNAPLKIAVKEISAVDEAPAVRKHDVFTDEQWRDLTKTQTNDNIAYGFILDDIRQWQSVDRANEWYDSEDKHTFGALVGHSSAEVHLKAKYGFAFGNSTAKLINHNVVYEVSLA